jgi:FkbM family methyltransferase
MLDVPMGPLLRMALARHFPSLGPYKRFMIAARDALLPKRTYSQHAEDLRVSEMLSVLRLDDAMAYIDVGANHPSDISNTYLLYRMGHSGLVVDPNPEVVRLHRLFRPRDTALAVGCGDASAVAKFTIAKTPVLSTFQELAPEEAWKTVIAPILPLDVIVDGIAPDWIPFLNIDTEGLSASVLRGARRTLAKTYLVCIEAAEGSDEEACVLPLLEEAGFSLLERLGCNVLAVNRESALVSSYLRKNVASPVALRLP